MSKPKKSPMRSTSALPEEIDDSAPPVPVPEAPESALSRTAPVEDDVAALGDTNTINLLDLEKRIGLLTRIVLEAALRAPRHLMTLKDKADVALRAITVLEGSKQQVTWRDEMLRKPAPTSVAQYEKEMKEREDNLIRLLTRRKEIRVKEAQEALDAADVDDTKIS